MSVNINEFKKYTEYLSNKSQNGNSLSVDEFNRAANAAQLQVYEKDRAVYVSESLTSDFLKTFLKTKIFNGPFITGEITSPSDLQHITDMYSYHVKKDGKGMNVPIKETKNTDWGEVISSELFKGTSRHPKFSEFGDKIRITPTDLKTVTVDYFSTPTQPIWAYTTVSDRPVYDPISSVNFDWDEFAMNNVAANFLSLVGVNLKDGELSQFAQMYKQETNSVI